MYVGRDKLCGCDHHPSNKQLFKFYDPSYLPHGHLYLDRDNLRLMQHVHYAIGLWYRRWLFLEWLNLHAKHDTDAGATTYA
jgi:hypothetical protein